MPEPEHIPTGEAARLLGYSVQHVRRLVREGKLRGSKLGRDWLVERASVGRFLAEQHELVLPLTERGKGGRRRKPQARGSKQPQ